MRWPPMFDPVGFWGQASWYALFPIHQRVFSGMLRGIGRAAERADRVGTRPGCA